MRGFQRARRRAQHHVAAAVDGQPKSGERIPVAGRELREIAATIDKVFAASPAIVAALFEAYWIGHDSATAMSWRHHVIAGVWAVFAIADLFATDITNQRLRMRQMNLGQQAD